MNSTENEMQIEINRLQRELKNYKKREEVLDLDKEISNILFKLRIPVNFKGFPLLREAIKDIYLQHTTIDIQITLLYRELAEQFNTTPSRVERVMRHAIESAWYKDSKGFKFLNEYLDEKPKNAEFLALTVNYLRLNK